MNPAKPNYIKVLELFRIRYKLVPLEIFGNDPYKTLISTLMSARTNDDTTLTASLRLFEKAPDIYFLNKLTEAEIAELIYPVGFYKTKAKHLKLLSEKIIIDFKGAIPQTREELVSLPGVGRKTANLVLNRAFGIPAIAVDTHVHRISNLLGWVNTTKPEKTELALMEKVPKKHWYEINKLMVSIGRQFVSKKKLIEFLKKEKLI